MATIDDGIRALTGPVGDVGGRWMLHPDVLGPCRGAGYPNGYAYYVTGRGGVLGDVEADVVTAAFGFFAPSLVRTMWEKGVPVEGARAAAARYGAACAEWGRSRMHGFQHVDRLAELAARVATGADAAGLPLFAGWRAEPRPDDPAGRAYFLVHVLRELRGSVHLLAVLAGGGVEQASRFGWVAPFDESRVDMRPAELLTDRMLASLYAAVLAPDEVRVLSELVLHLQEHLDHS